MITYSLNVYSLVTSDSIVSIEGTSQPGVVTNVKWEYVASDSSDGLETRWVGKTDLDVSAISNSSFTLFGNLQQETVKQWILDHSEENMLSEIEVILAKKLDALRKKQSTEMRMPPWI